MLGYDKSMIILGIDPGIARLGFALLETTNPSHLNLLNCGVVETSKALSEAQRLCEIRSDLQILAHKYQPDILAIEKIFFFKNPKTIIPVTQARGVVLELACRLGLDIFEYTPLEVKKTITGQGMASKSELAQMVYQILDIQEPIKPDDAMDAVAIAISATRISPLIYNKTLK